ncbi:cysteine--tRNA ligase [Xylocopilactobacillus apicola]|uniref:Cysteine--tRNA ligase n=1 Tax=Xylocopilactobacillus apicola TaxID=2932184 RepID=A0AAU9CXY9_9LACO|nr:cysteine--tRNA ligase [Xylocopilactobacillus apicola]BDR58889.1 cysteine--tRNA ligase [Xylocopilactobacillus apicola]
MLKIYNTLSRTKEEFIPQSSKVVTMYVCGPTVYNYIHIGNARSVVAFDTIRRYLMYRGYEVRFVSNFTDVDDRMIERSSAEKVTVSDLAAQFIAAYEEDIEQLNVIEPTVRTRATEFIPQIVDFIAKLIQKGYAYESEGDVYFRTRKYPTYGELSDQSVADLLVGASEHVNSVEQARKEDSLDFALWKGQKQNEIAWDAPFGKGRPGWHIECSVMSIAELGDTIDIHGGGEDLMFPHHENERAQSESLTGKQFVRYWMHNAFVTTANDEKMSKSLGNFVTLRDALKENDPNFLRFFLVQTNYRKPLQYDLTSMTQAKRSYDRIIETINQLRNKPSADVGFNPRISDLIAKFRDRFMAAMDDDFNVQNALAVIYEYLKWINKDVLTKDISTDNLKEIQQLLVDWLWVLGLEVPERLEIDDPHVLNLIEKRDAARKARDFKLSDDLRDELLALGIEIKDTPEGTKYTKNDKC